MVYCGQVTKKTNTLKKTLYSLFVASVEHFCDLSQEQEINQSDY